MESKKSLALKRITADAADKAKNRVDGWLNLLTGLGNSKTGRDKRMAAQAVFPGGMDERQAEELYASDDIAARVVDLLPEEALREWIEFKFEDHEVGDALQEVMEVLEVQNRLEDAWKDARRYGGSGIFLNVEDGELDLTKPLIMERVRSLRSLVVLNRHELWNQTIDIDRDIKSPNFGLPMIYTIRPRGQAGTTSLNLRIHHSRIIRFDGAKLPKQLFVENSYWNDSVLNRMENVLRNYNTCYDSAASIVQDFRAAVYKIKGLADLIAAGKEDLVKKRFQILDQCRAVIGSTLIDDEESFEYTTGSIAGLSQVLQKMDDRLVASTDMPHSIILGTNVRGKMGEGSGENEKRDWYDHVKNRQKSVLTKPITLIAQIILNASRGPTAGKEPEEWSFKFNPLWQLSDQEKAATRKLTAETDAVYIGQGVLDPEEVRESRFGSDEYSMETQIDDSAKPLALAPPEPETPVPAPTVPPGNPPIENEGE